MDKATIIKQDKKQDSTVDITTTQTETGYVTIISIKLEGSTSIEEITVEGGMPIFLKSNSTTSQKGIVRVLVELLEVYSNVL